MPEQSSAKNHNNPHMPDADRSADESRRHIPLAIFAGSVLLASVFTGVVVGGCRAEQADSRADQVFLGLKC